MTQDWKTRFNKEFGYEVQGKRYKWFEHLHCECEGCDSGKDGEEVIAFIESLLAEEKEKLRERIASRVYSSENCYDHKIVNPLCDRCAARQGHNMALKDVLEIIK